MYLWYKNKKEEKTIYLIIRENLKNIRDPDVITPLDIYNDSHISHALQ